VSNIIKILYLVFFKQVCHSMYNVQYVTAENSIIRKCDKSLLAKLLGFPLDIFELSLFKSIFEYHYCNNKMAPSEPERWQGSTRAPTWHDCCDMPQHGWVQCCIPAVGVDRYSQLSSPFFQLGKKGDQGRLSCLWVLFGRDRSNLINLPLYNFFFCITINQSVAKC
jgi:hypothetical protein